MLQHEIPEAVVGHDRVASSEFVVQLASLGGHERAMMPSMQSTVNKEAKKEQRRGARNLLHIQLGLLQELGVALLVSTVDVAGATERGLVQIQGIAQLPPALL